MALWQSISEEEPEDHTVEIVTPPKKKMPHTNSLPSAERENIFSPQEVRKRSSSMKKAGGSTEIAVITRTGSHGQSFSAEDVPSPSSRSPEFSFGTRNRSQSERMGPSRLFRRLSSGARLEGAAKAAVELSRLDELLDSPNKSSGGGPPGYSSPAPGEGNKPTRRSSTAGNYVRSAAALYSPLPISFTWCSRYKSHVLRSSTYTQALASDAINELHPDQLARFMKVLSSPPPASLPHHPRYRTSSQLTSSCLIKRSPSHLSPL
jgi:hypothetical protein